MENNNKKKRKCRTNYRFREMSILKSFIILILMVALTGVSVTTYFTMRNAVIWETRALRSEEREEETSKAWLPTSKSLFDTNEELHAKYELLLHQPKSDVGLWEVYTVTAYTSLDEGVNNISAIGMDIGKWSSYMNFVAVAGDSYIEYGDTVLIRMNDGEIKSYTAVDTGGALTTGDPDKAEIDIYMGVDIDAAFEFGKQRLECWVIKD